MVNIILTWINRNRIQVNSPYLIEEMEAFEKGEDNTQIRAAYGEHDDRIMALGFILFAFHIHEIHSDKITTADRRESEQGQADPEWDPGFQGRDHGTPGLAEVSLDHLIRATAGRGGTAPAAIGYPVSCVWRYNRGRRRASV